MDKEVEKVFIEHLCQFAGKTPSSLAKAAGLAPSTLNRRTKSDVNVTHSLGRKSLEQLSGYLNIPLEFMISHKEKIAKALKENKDIPPYKELGNVILRETFSNPGTDILEILSRVALIAAGGKGTTYEREFRRMKKLLEIDLRNSRSISADEVISKARALIESDGE